jgi:isopenicillin N synthase-like dioxygenase
VINTGDAMEFLSGGFYKPTIHRIVRPPVDQRPYDRLGVIYFAMLDDDVRLIPFAESPVLQKLSIQRRYRDDLAPAMETWRRNMTISYGQVDLKKGPEEDVEEELVNGIIVKHYT